MKSFFVFDVESVGLHGEGFSVAGGVYLENGAVQWEFCFACPIDECSGDESDRKWVKENIPQLEITHRTPGALRESFWVEWVRAKAYGAEAAAECLWPVEAGFMARCVADDAEARKFSGPYPFHEISSYMAAAGMNPMDKYDRTESETPAHNPLCDARQSARLLSEAISKLK